jgi:hypothetical protein
LPGPLTRGHSRICDFYQRSASGATEPETLLGPNDITYSAALDDNLFAAFCSIEDICKMFANL